MTDTPRKTLTLKRKPAPEPSSELAAAPPAPVETSAEPAARETRLLGKKVIIRREETRPNKPNANSKNKPNNFKNKTNNPRHQEPKVDKPTEPSPSEIQAKAMDRFLAERYESWLLYRPLALGVEAELYQLMDQNQPPASKRVVQRLLRMHCNHGKYLQAVADGQQRYTLAGEAISEISETERQHAHRTLKEQDEKKAKH